VNAGGWVVIAAALAASAPSAARADDEAAPVPRVTGAAESGGAAEPAGPAPAPPAPVRRAPAKRAPVPPRTAAIATPAPRSEVETPTTKKAAYLASKRAAPPRPWRPATRVGAAPARVVSLFNTWTHEWIAVEPGGALPAPTLVGRFLRCHYTNEPTSMDPRLIGTLVNAARHFSVVRVDVVSGFRHPKYNLMLRKKGHEVAKESHHTRGTAVDFRLPGVSTPALHAWARARGMGGVGLYLESGFVHMDTGPVRYWGGK
jgi:uncharacterized protein YcbK (DUF882 family)